MENNAVLIFLLVDQTFQWLNLLFRYRFVTIAIRTEYQLGAVYKRRPQSGGRGLFSADILQIRGIL